MNKPLMGKTLRTYASVVSEDGLEADDTRDVCELLRVLARVCEGKSVEEAFGCPGDWGYGTPIGDAIASHNTPRA